MTEYQINLLKSAYQNYLKTYNDEYSFVPSNSKELVTTLNSLSSLEEDGYIEVLSDNLDKRKLTLFENGHISEDMVFSIRLTSFGKDYIRSNFKF